MSEDLIAALALVLVFEGLAVLILARSMHDVVAALSEMDETVMQRGALVAILVGVLTYLLARGAFTG